VGCRYLRWWRFVTIRRVLSAGLAFFVGNNRSLRWSGKKFGQEIREVRDMYRRVTE
jgi:hypothetical protein